MCFLLQVSARPVWSSTRTKDSGDFFKENRNPGGGSRWNASFSSKRGVRSFIFAEIGATSKTLCFDQDLTPFHCNHGSWGWEHDPRHRRRSFLPRCRQFQWSLPGRWLRTSPNKVFSLKREWTWYKIARFDTWKWQFQMVKTQNERIACTKQPKITLKHIHHHPAPSFITQPPPPQMPKTSECLRSSLWQVNFAYVDKWGAKSDWQTCLLVYVRKYPLRFKWFEVKLSSSRCYGASWKLLVSPGAQKELKYWSSDWKYRLEW